MYQLIRLKRETTKKRYWRYLMSLGKWGNGKKYNWMPNSKFRLSISTKYDVWPGVSKETGVRRFGELMRIFGQISWSLAWPRPGVFVILRVPTADCLVVITPQHNQNDTLADSLLLLIGSATGKNCISILGVNAPDKIHLFSVAFCSDIQLSSSTKNRSDIWNCNKALHIFCFGEMRNVLFIFI